MFIAVIKGVGVRMVVTFGRLLTVVYKMENKLYFPVCFPSVHVTISKNEAHSLNLNYPEVVGICFQTNLFVPIQGHIVVLCSKYCRVHFFVTLPFNYPTLCIFVPTLHNHKIFIETITNEKNVRKKDVSIPILPALPHHENIPI